MKLCAYILPTNLAHEGIKIKVFGQLKSLNKRFRTKLISLKYQRHQFFIFKIFFYIFFLCQSGFFCLLARCCYVRYNPKALPINVWVLFLSFMKPVYIEHNTIMDTELVFLNRHIEHKLHLCTLFLFRFSRLIHIAVNDELRNHLTNKKLNRVIYSQNGYHVPQYTLSDIDQDIIENVLKFKQSYKKTGLFCGNGYAWHGCEDIIHLFKNQPDIGLIIVGPYTHFSQHDIIQISYGQEVKSAKKKICFLLSG